MELCDCGAAPNGFTINAFDEKDCICEKCAKDQDLKKCSKCPLWQKRNQFGWRNKSKGKRTPHCAECEKKRNAKYRKSAKGKASRAKYIKSAKRKASRAKYKKSAKGKAATAKYRKTAKYKANKAKYCNSAKSKACIAKYRKTAKGKATIAKYNKSAEGKASMAKHRKTAKFKAATKARRSTAEGKLLQSTRGLLREFYLGTLGPSRLKQAKKLVGCSRRVYRYAIFSQWKPGMCRDNKGKGKDKWNIDHRVPFAAYKGRLEANLPIICWYGNIQPLWYVENMKKGGRTKDEEIESLHMRYQAWLSTVH